MQLYLIRHGQSENNALAGESPETADPGLTRTGQAQARSVALHLRHCADKTDVRDGLVGEPGYGLGRLFCSPMLRALETARPIGDWRRKSGWTSMKPAVCGSIGRTGVAGWATEA